MKKLKFYLVFSLVALVIASCTNSSGLNGKTDNARTAEMSKVIKKARTYTGTKYKWGGNDKSGIDCSGLICQSYAEIGFKMPRVAGDQSRLGKKVNVKEIGPGDLVFFTDKPGNKKITHVGMVTVVKSATEIMFIHASSKVGVCERNLLSNYYQGIFLFASRPKP